MTAEDFRRAIRRAAAQARESEPTDTSRRARCFTAALTGRLVDEELEMAKLIWAMVSDKALDPDSVAA